METLDQLREFEDRCLKSQSTKQVIVRKPRLEKHFPKKEIQPTQSYYYMPIITEAYYVAKGEVVPQEILNMSGRITRLPKNGFIDVVDFNYDSIIEAVVNYLLIDGKLTDLEQHYSLDTKPTANNVGHISGNKQEEILNGSNVGYIIDNLLNNHHFIINKNKKN